MKVATLALLLRDNKVFLGRKKKGEIGAQTLNGPGGKCEENESPLDCVIRETQEETGVVLDKVQTEKIAVITFFAGGVADFEMHVFRTTVFSGEPQETEEMIPAGWYGIDSLPTSEMLESDREWFPKTLMGERFNAHVSYSKRAAGFEKIKYFPFE